MIVAMSLTFRSFPTLTQHMKKNHAMYFLTDSLHLSLLTLYCTRSLQRPLFDVYDVSVSGTVPREKKWLLTEMFRLLLFPPSKMRLRSPVKSLDCRVDWFRREVTLTICAFAVY